MNTLRTKQNGRQQQNFVEDRLWEFKVMTENELGIK